MAINVDVIISRRENLNEVYQSFGKDMDSYLAKMGSSVDAIKDTVSMLGNSWKGNDYNEFRSAMMKAMEQIDSSLARGQELKKLMSEAQQELAQGLQILRQKYGK